MSKRSTVLGAVIVCLGLLFSASIIMASQDQAAPSKEKTKNEQVKTDTVTISGTVSAVTDSAVTIIDSEKAEHTVAITSETKVIKGGKDAALADVKANDVVTIEAKKGAGDAWMALKISVS